MNREKLRSYMEQKGIDAFYVARPENVRYISGYKGTDSYLFITGTKQYFVTDARYTEQASYECPEYEIVNWRTNRNNTLGDAIVALAAETQVNAVGFEEDYLTYSIWNAMQEKMKAELVPTTGVIEELRSVKSLEEIKCLRAACDITSRAFDKILGDIHVGMTEKEIASKLSHYMVMEGADTKPYGGIVISGAKTSLLHGIPDEKTVEYGDFVLMDFGCQYKGHMSDMTRTIVVGKADARQREVYDICRRMTEDVISILKPGVTGQECYEASLKAIKDTEYLQYNYQGIGHGVGLYVHEPPFIGNNSKYVLQENNVLTVEPGIYIPAWGGVRVEDQLLITPSGCENLISVAHTLIEI